MILPARSKAYRAAAKRADFHAVCLIGWDGPRPAYFGDNRGIWPVRIVTTTREMQAADTADRETPHVGVIVMEYVMVASAAHAKRLKDALDEVLLGQQEEQENQPLRGRWRDCRECWQENDEIGRQLWWCTILEDAQRILSKTSTSFDIFDADEAHRRISKRAMKGN